MKIYFTGEFSARRPITVAGGIVMTGIGSGLAFVWFSQSKKPMDALDLVEALPPGLFILFFLSFGLFIITKVIQNAKTTLAVTSSGISYGHEVFGWEDITEIGIMKKYAGRRDLYCTARSDPRLIELLLSRGLTSEQIDGLFKALREEVVVRYPHVFLSEE